jgi:hypothetical protein
VEAEETQDWVAWGNSVTEAGRGTRERGGRGRQEDTQFDASPQRGSEVYADDPVYSQAVSRSVELGPFVRWFALNADS